MEERERGISELGSLLITPLQSSQVAGFFNWRGVLMFLDGGPPPITPQLGVFFTGRGFLCSWMGIPSYHLPQSS